MFTTNEGTWHRECPWGTAEVGPDVVDAMFVFRAGVVGICLGMAGARVTLTDLPHITPLTAENLALNADKRTIDAEVSPWPGSGPCCKFWQPAS